MRLSEVINFEPRDSGNREKSYNDAIRKMPSSNMLGSGSFGRAFGLDSGKRLNQVTKTGRAGNVKSSYHKSKDIKEDGYLSYLYAIHNSNSKNSYFPRIYDLRLFRDKDGSLNYKADIEKLVPFGSRGISGNEDLMKSLFDDMFTEEYTGHRLDLLDTMLVKMEKAVGFDEFSEIKDPELKDALKLIRSVMYEGDFMSDFHSGNVMWRITGTRPQLVITDPLA